MDALAEAAWLEADLALAEALADFDELEGARDDADKAHAMVLLAQSLARAGRKRGLARLGILGATEPYDPSRHEYIAPGKPKTVRIKARGVARGGEILVKPRAGPSRRKKAL
ncbi:MAG: hypothetical protein JNM59_01320 [Hyphomonadaceae bacterium]|nr:hypothetical protein [Hyphomonadaceae bacterium]